MRLGQKSSLSLQVDFVNTPLLYSDRATPLKNYQFGHYGFCQRQPKVTGLHYKYTGTLTVMPEMRLEPLKV